MLDIPCKEFKAAITNMFKELKRDMVNNSPFNAGDVEHTGLIPGWGRSLEKGMAAWRILAWRIPWTEKPGRLQSMGSQ